MGFESRWGLGIFFFLKIHIDSGDHPASFSIDTVILGLKRKGFEFDSSVPCSAEEKNEWNYTFTPHRCFEVCHPRCAI